MLKFPVCIGILKEDNRIILLFEVRNIPIGRSIYQKNKIEINVSLTLYNDGLEAAKDIKIIKELNRNSRQPFSRIGRKVGLPKNVVTYRVKRLIDRGVLTLFCTTVNREKLGYMYWRLFLKFRHFSGQIENDLIAHISRLKNIHWVASLDGSFDFCIIFYFIWHFVLPPQLFQLLVYLPFR